MNLTVNNIVPISAFNKGMAGKVFDNVKRTGPKVVIKNNEPEIVMMSLDEYNRMSSRIDDLEDTVLRLMAEERLRKLDESQLVPGEEVFRKNGITADMLDAVGDVEIE